MAQIDDAVDEVAGLLRGSVNLGMVTGCSIPGVMDALAEVHRAHPNLTVTLVEGPSDWLQRRVLGGDLDLALVGYATRADPGLREGIVIDEPLVAAVPHDDALAGRAEVTLSELAARVVLSLPPGTGVRFALDAAIAAHAPDVRVGLEASAPVTVAGLAARGLGVAVLSASMVADDVRLTALPITEPALHSCLGLVWPDRAHLSAASRAVLSALAEALGTRTPAR